MNYGDISKIDASTLPNFDLLTWGFPCQDISLAGRMKGIKEGETRSGLYFEGYRILKEKRPAYSIIENVKNLTSKRFKNEFETILRDLSELGYTNYWKVLNAKDYGIPQNRERVFIISVRNDIAKSGFCFPTKIPLKWKLKDFLECNVDEKYYLSEKAIGRLIRKSNRLIRDMKNPMVSSCIVSTYYKSDGRNSQYISENINIKENARIYDKNNQGKQTSNNSLNKLTLENKNPFVLIKEGTKIGYSKAKIGDSINISYPSNIKKRGRVGKEISQAILTYPTMATLEKIKPICINNKGNKLRIQDRIYSIEGISTSIVASSFRSKIMVPTSTQAVLVSENTKQYMRIRRLTPLECWRLMGFSDEDFYCVKSIGISDTQLYRQAGNSIVVNTLEYILKELFQQEIIDNQSYIEPQKCA